MRIQLKANNAGRLISRGRGGHISRIIRNWELIFVLKSRLEMFVGGESFDVTAEHCLLLPPGIRHGGRGGYTPDLSFFWIHFLPADRKSEQYLKKLPRRFKAMNPARLSEYFQLFLSLQEDSPEDEEGLDMLVQLILHEACLWCSISGKLCSCGSANLFPLRSSRKNCNAIRTIWGDSTGIISMNPLRTP